MEGIFHVTRGAETVGRVEVKREGLYCRVICRCRVPEGRVHRLYASGEKIGVLIPDRGELVLETKVAAKRLKPGCSFSLDETGGDFYTIHPGMQFAHLDKLRRGKLTFRNGEPGLFLEV